MIRPVEHVYSIFAGRNMALAEWDGCHHQKYH